MIERIKAIVGETSALQEEPMSLHTTFRVGGNARYLAQPHDPQQLQALLELCRQEQLPYYVVGNGSNLLVSDRGYDGMIIHLFKNMD